MNLKRAFKAYPKVSIGAICALGGCSSYGLFKSVCSAAYPDKYGAYQPGLPEYRMKTLVRNLYWVYYRDGVYDLYPYEKQHPGGKRLYKFLFKTCRFQNLAPILKFCPHTHSEESMDILENSCRIGNLRRTASGWVDNDPTKVQTLPPQAPLTYAGDALPHAPNTALKPPTVQSLDRANDPTKTHSSERTETDKTVKPPTAQDNPSTTAHSASPSNGQKDTSGVTPTPSHSDEKL